MIDFVLGVWFAGKNTVEMFQFAVSIMYGIVQGIFNERGEAITIFIKCLTVVFD